MEMCVNTFLLEKLLNFLEVSLKNCPFNTLYLAMLHKCSKLKNREKSIKYEDFDIFILYLFYKTKKNKK